MIRYFFTLLILSNIPGLGAVEVLEPDPKLRPPPPKLKKGPFYYARLDPFGDHGHCFGPILTKLGTPSTFMGLLMM